MGFFDAIEKVAKLTKQGLDLTKQSLDKMDERTKKQMSKKSDSELKNMKSSNKYVREELKKRGL